MARDAWDDVTPETIKNCWSHADIQHDPIVLCILLTMTQKGWNIIHTFANPSSGMALPQAEESLKKIFGNQYNDTYWWPALKLITGTEPDEDVHLLIKTLQEKLSHSANQPFIPTKYTRVGTDVASTIKELESRNQIFEGAPSADSFIEPEREGEIEAMLVHTNDQLVAEVLKEKAIEEGEIQERDDDSK